MTARTIRLAVIGGDGIGPEVVTEAIKVLRTAATGVTIETTGYDLGSQRWLRTGEILPASVLNEISGHDAILLGAVGDPSVPSGVLERGLLLKLRFEFDQYVNLRPVRLYPGVASPLSGLRSESVDMLVVREGTEGPYIEARRCHAQGHGRRGRYPGEHQHRVRRPAGDAVRAAACFRPGRAGSSPWSTSRTCSPTPGTCGGAPSTSSPRSSAR